MRSLGTLGALSLLLAACEVPSGHRPEEPEMFVSAVFEGLDPEIVWTVLELELGKKGFEIDPHLTNRKTGDFETRWTEYLMPFRFEGKRKKLVGKIVEVPERPGWFQVKTLMWVQRNADLENPMDSRKAIWQDEAPDTVASEVFLFAVERHFPAPGGGASPVRPSPAGPAGPYDR